MSEIGNRGFRLISLEQVLWQMRNTKIKKNFSSSSPWTCLHHMVTLRTQNKITDFLMILV